MKEKICPTFLVTFKRGAMNRLNGFRRSLRGHKDLFFRSKAHVLVSMSSSLSGVDRIRTLLVNAVQKTVCQSADGLFWHNDRMREARFGRCQSGRIIKRLLLVSSFGRSC
jgi:hypothetical protein